MCLIKQIRVSLKKGLIGYTIIKYHRIKSMEIGAPYFSSLYISKPVKINQWETNDFIKDIRVNSTGVIIFNDDYEPAEFIYKLGYHHFINLSEALEYWRKARPLFDTPDTFTLLCPAIMKDVNETGLILDIPFNMGVTQKTVQIAVCQKRFVLPVRYIPGPRGLYTFFRLKPEDLRQISEEETERENENDYL